MTLDTEHLYDHWPAVLAYCRKRVRGFDDAVAEDLASAVLEKALRNAERFVGDEARTRIWLYTIARNAITDWRRRGSLVTFVPDITIVDYHRATTDAGSDRHVTGLDLWPAVDRLPDAERRYALQLADGVRPGLVGLSKTTAWRRRQTIRCLLKATVRL